jgi:CheY-specific phosphatase CheX
MTTTDSQRDASFPPAVADAVHSALTKTFADICGEKPVPQADGSLAGSGACVAGIISFIGDVSWSLSWVLAEDTAPAVVHKFAGMDIPFYGADMGDAVGELVNVLAGEVVAQLEQRRIKAQMSLPTVARGQPLELMSQGGAAVHQREYNSTQGKFWLRLTSAKTSSFRGRIPGK